MKKNNNKNKILKIIKDNNVQLILGMIIIAINFFSYKKLLLMYENVELIQSNSTIIFIIVLIIELLFLALYNILIKRVKKLEFIFLAMIIPIGISYLLLTPIGRIPDEQNHYRRALEISYGHLLSEINDDGVSGRKYSNDTNKIFDYDNDYIKYSDVKNNLKLKKEEEKTFQTFPNTSVYSFVCYIPQAIGIFFGRVLHLPTLVGAYLGRLFNFGLWVLLIFFAIKIIPFKKKSLFVISFMPMMIQEAVSLAADSLTNGMAVFLISYVLYLKYSSKKKISIKQLIVLGISTVVMSLCKIVYLPLCLILFLIPATKFESKKDKYKKIAIIAAIVIVLNLVWLFISSSYLNEIKPGVNPSAQLEYIIRNPLAFMKASFNTVYDHIYLILFNVIGISLCYFDVNLSFFYILVYFILILYLAIVDNNKKIDKYDKLLSLFVIFSVTALMFTSLYLQWNVVTSNYVDGIQGRYFIPLLLPLLLVLNNKEIEFTNDKKMMVYIINIVLFINMYVELLLLFKHL